MLLVRFVDCHSRRWNLSPNIYESAFVFFNWFQYHLGYDTNDAVYLQLSEYVKSDVNITPRLLTAVRASAVLITSVAGGCSLLQAHISCVFSMLLSLQRSDKTGKLFKGTTLEFSQPPLTAAMKAPVYRGHQSRDVHKRIDFILFLIPFLHDPNGVVHLLISSDVESA